MTDQPDGNSILDSLAENAELSASDKVFMWVNLCDDKILKDNLLKSAMMAKIGMAVASPVDTFAYGVLRLAKPYLFESNDETP